MSAFTPQNPDPAYHKSVLNISQTSSSDTESIEEGREGNVWIRMSKVLSVVTFAVSLIFPPIAIITGIIALILIVVPLLDRKTSDSTGMILAIVALVWSFVVNAVIVTIVLVVAYNGLKQL